MSLNIWYVSKYISPPDKGAVGGRGYLIMKELALMGHKIALITSNSNQMVVPPKLDENYLTLNPVSFPIYIDMDLEYDWGVPGLPTTFLISPTGEMLYRAVGKRDFASPDMEKFFNTLIDDYKK